MSPAPELSVIVLCYRGEERTKALVESLHADLQRSGVPFELVLVANYWPGGQDRTPAIVDSLAGESGDVRIVSGPKAGAMGWDLRSGLGAAKGEYLVYLDGDGQVQGHDALRAYRLLRDGGAAIVKGRRRTRGDGPLRGFTSFVFNGVFRLLFGTRGLWDVNGQPKGFTRAAYERLELRTDDWFTDAEIVLKARERGLEIAEFPVVFHKREAGSLVGPLTIAEFLVNMARWRLGRHPAQRRGGRLQRPRRLPARL